MIAITKDQLGDDIKETAICPACSKRHPIIWSKDKDRKETRMLGAVRCGDGKLYFAALNGKQVKQ